MPVSSRSERPKNVFQRIYKATIAVTADRCTEIPIGNTELNIAGMQAVLHMSSQGSADHTIMHKGCFA